MRGRQGGAALLATVVSRTVLMTFVGLLVWATLPALVGLQTTVVMSGSMEPRIMTGDVVVLRELPLEELREGHVVLVDDPDQLDQLRLHRYDEATDDGQLILHGDANAQPDSTPVSPEAVHGVGMLRVPWVGLPMVWIAHGQYARIIIGLLVLAGLALLTRAHTDDETSTQEQPTPDAPTSPSLSDSQGSPAEAK